RACRLVEHQVDMAGDLVLDGGAAASIGHELEASAGRTLKIDGTDLGRTTGSDSCSRCLVRICLEPAASGQATAAPPSSVMNWRRLRLGMGSPPEPAVPAYRRLRMHRKGPAGPWGRPEMF